MKPNFLIIDAARTYEKIQEAPEILKNSYCLYNEKGDEVLSSVAPYVVDCEISKNTLQWVEENVWGNSGCTFLFSNILFDKICIHLKHFITAKIEDGQELYFRFYDPRVLKIFLPSCNKQQILEFFGPVEYFIVEGETKEEAIVFKQRNGELIEEKIAASQVFGDLVEDKTLINKEQQIMAEGKKPPRRFIF